MYVVRIFKDQPVQEEAVRNISNKERQKQCQTRNATPNLNIITRVYDVHGMLSFRILDYLKWLFQRPTPDAPRSYKFKIWG